MRLKMSPESQQQVSGFLRICGTARCESYSVEYTVQARHRLTAHTVKNKQGGRGSLHPQLAHTQRINSFNTCNKELFKRDPSSFINHISCLFVYVFLSVHVCVFQHDESHRWCLTSHSMLCFSRITGCMEMSRKSHTALWGFSAFQEPRVKRRLRDVWKNKGERERPVKYCTRSYTVIPAAQCHLRLPPLSASSPWCLNPVESMGSSSSGETQTKTARYSNKSLVGWFL